MYGFPRDCRCELCLGHSLTSALCLGSTKGSALVESVKVTSARQTRWHWPKPMLTVGLFRSLILKRRFGPLPAEHKHHQRCPPTSSGYTFTVSEVDFGTLKCFISGTLDSSHFDDGMEILRRFESERFECLKFQRVTQTLLCYPRALCLLRSELVWSH